jgi:hypothetical protein
VPGRGCNHLVAHCKLDAHAGLCADVRVACRDCKVLVARGLLKGHVADECPETVVRCSFHASCGCPTVLRRREIEAHQRDAGAHLALAMAKVAQLGAEVAKVAQLSAQVDEAKKEIAAAKAGLVEATQEMAGVGRALDVAKRSIAANATEIDANNKSAVVAEDDLNEELQDVKSRVEAAEGRLEKVETCDSVRLKWTVGSFV